MADDGSQQFVVYMAQQIVNEDGSPGLLEEVFGPTDLTAANNFAATLAPLAPAPGNGNVIAHVLPLMPVPS